MLVRLEQPQNAQSAIEVTPSGITTLRILVHPWNKYGLTNVISEGITISITNSLFTYRFAPLHSGLPYDSKLILYHADRLLIQTFSRLEQL